MRGHVRKRGNKWCFVLDVGRDENGKRQRKWFSGFNTKREAEKAMSAKIQEVETGTYVEPAKESIEEYFNRWLEDKKTQIRYKTFRQYEWLVRVHIIPGLGKIQISKLRPPHLQSFYTSLLDRDEPLAPRTVLHIHRIVHQALDRAVKWGVIARNPAEAVDTPRAESYQAKVWEPEQVTSFLRETQTIEPRYWVAFVLAIMTGMRQAEILGLRWIDVDWEGGFLKVQRTLNYVQRKPVFKELKTDRSKRSVALSTDTIEALKWHRVKQAHEKLLMGDKYKDSGMVLCTQEGRPLSQNTITKVWKRLIDQLDVPRIRFHDLRHTHASLMLAQGIHPKIVSERLGHANINVTLDTYSHVLPSLQKEAANSLNGLLKKATK